MKPMVLIICLFFCGCATMRQMREQAQEAVRINANIQNAVTQKPNLMGWTSAQLVQQFGNTGNVSTTYNAAGTLQDEKYSCIDASNTKYEFEVILQNSSVTSVQYFPPHALPAPTAQAPADDPNADLANTIKAEQQKKEEAYQQEIDREHPGLKIYQ
jgi:hypothetical protein